ncbi:MAG: hypothetical protein QXU88_00700 [Candidatus Woesearchaeota archaeon]
MMKIKKIVALLSGGIDSPVAAMRAMAKGVDVSLAHFYNVPDRIDSKIVKLAEIISKGRQKGKLKLYLIPFRETQLEVIKAVPADYRMIIYKRLMLRISNEIAKKERAQAILTGDSLGQVASQTLDNTRVIYQVSSLPVLTPLLGMDKEEIVKEAKALGSYEVSILPYLDCCSFIIGRQPVTRARLEDVERLEKGLNIKRLIAKAMAGAEVREV